MIKGKVSYVVTVYTGLIKVVPATKIFSQLHLYLNYCMATSNYPLSHACVILQFSLEMGKGRLKFLGEENTISVLTIHVQCWGARGHDRSMSNEVTAS